MRANRDSYGEGGISGFRKYPRVFEPCWLQISFFFCAKVSLSVYYPVAQYVGISQSSPFAITSLSKIEALCLASWKVSALFEALLEAFHSLAIQA